MITKRILVEALPCLQEIGQDPKKSENLKPEKSNRIETELRGLQAAACRPPLRCTLAHFMDFCLVSQTALHPRHTIHRLLRLLRLLRRRPLQPLVVSRRPRVNPLLLEARCAN
jgi:hypothetical protein